MTIPFTATWLHLRHTGGGTDSVVVASRLRLVYWRMLVGLALGLAVCAFGVRPLYAADRSFSVSVRAFIPGDVANARSIPGQSGTMVSIPLIDNVIGCFDTDQRGFSNSRSASSRVTATVRATDKLDSHRFGKTCGVTKRRNCGTGQVTHQASCEANKEIKISHQQISASIHEYQLSASGKNPLVPAAPRIDFNITVTEEWAWNPRRVVFKIDGKVDDFPAYEGYVTFEGQTQTLFRLGPRPGATPMALMGKAKRRVSGQATFHY